MASWCTLGRRRLVDRRYSSLYLASTRMTTKKSKAQLYTNLRLWDGKGGDGWESWFIPTERRLEEHRKKEE